jgi:O-antigen/teichoic acid export membrane protein
MTAAKAERSVSPFRLKIPGDVAESSSLRLLGRDTLIYGSGIVLSRAASFLMLPIYTRYLTPDDYGILQLLQLTVDVAGILLTAGFVSALYRYYFKTRFEHERNAVVTTSLVLFTIANAIGAALLLTASPIVARHLLAGGGQADLVRIVAATFLLEVLTIVPLAYMQIVKRPGLFTMTSLGRLFLQLTLNVVFLIFLGMGVRGILLSSLITTGVVGAIISTWLLRGIGLQFDRSVAREITRFGLPYKFTNAGTFAINFSDRFFLKALSGLSAVGLYGLAAQFGMLVTSVASQPIMQAWNPRRFEHTHLERSERDDYYDRTFLAYNLVVVSCAVAVALFARPVIHIMAAPAFHSAAVFVPLLVAAQLIACWITVLGFGIDVSERTVYLSYATAVAAVVVIALHAVLIPPFGPMGAAVATLIGFLVRLTLVFAWAQRLWPITYRWGTHLRLVFFATLTVTIGVPLSSSPTVGRQALTAFGFFLAYLLAIWVGGVVRPEHKALVHRFTGRGILRVT